MTAEIIRTWVRVSVPDPYAGLTGHAYIAARGLSPMLINEQRHQCETCKLQEMLPAVIQLTENWTSHAN